MRFHFIDYLGVTGNKRDGWKVRYSRIGKTKFRCRSTKPKDVIAALWGWGVLKNPGKYVVVEEKGQYTVFESVSERPICAFFQLPGENNG